MISWLTGAGRWSSCYLGNLVHENRVDHPVPVQPRLCKDRGREGWRWAAEGRAETGQGGLLLGRPAAAAAVSAAALAAAGGVCVCVLLLLHFWAVSAGSVGVEEVALVGVWGSVKVVRHSSLFYRSWLVSVAQASGWIGSVVPACRWLDSVTRTAEIQVQCCPYTLLQSWHRLVKSRIQSAENVPTGHGIPLLYGVDYRRDAGSAILNTKKKNCFS